MKKLYMIINPVSGAGKSHAKLEVSEGILTKSGIEVTRLYSKQKGDFPSLVDHAIAEGADTIGIVGGDGTMREAVSALVGREVNTCLFPFGTGNDLALALKIPTDPIACTEKFLTGKPHKLDAGMVNDNYFLNVAGLGFDVEVLIQTEKYKNRFTAKSSYMMGLIHALLHLKAHKVTIKYNGREENFKSLIASVGNGRFIGGGMEAHPRAKPNDGLFDLCVIHNCKGLKIPPTLLKFLKGRHLDLSVTRYAQSTQFEITSDEELPIQLDGEIIEKTPAIFKLLPEALTFIL